MISIVRTVAPDVLHPTPNNRRKIYARPEVRQALSEMQYGKCCYCEKKIVFPEDENLLPVSNVEKHVEHFRPKGMDEYGHLTNDWSNLLLACNTCNVNKGMKFEEDQYGDPLCIDPSDPNVDPEEHIELKKIYLDRAPDIDTGKILPRNDSTKGKWTIANVKLNEGTCRKGRWRKSFEVLRVILDYREVLPTTEEGRIKLELIQSKCSASEEFAFVAREVCRQYEIQFEN